MRGEELPIVFPLLAAHIRHDPSVAVPGEEHTTFLEGLPHRSTDKRAGQRRTGMQHLCPFSGRRPRPFEIGLEVPLVDAAAGKYRHAGGECHGDLSAQQMDLQAPRAR